MTTANFRMLRERNQQMFYNGVVGDKLGFTLLRKNFVVPFDSLGEEKAYGIIKQSIRGWIQPDEGALRAMAEGSRVVQDFLLMTEPIWDGFGNPLIIPNDLLADASNGIPVINSDNTYTAYGPVYLVQYVKNYFDQFFEVRCKVGQVGRT
jgi:hypothetical protein